MITTIREMFDETITKYGEFPAVRYKDMEGSKEKNYSQFGEDVRHIGNALLNKKIENLHLGVIGENSYDWMVMYFAALNSGTVLVPLAGELLDQTLIRFINQAQIKILVAGKQFIHKIEAIRDQLSCVEQIYEMNSTEKTGEYPLIQELYEEGKQGNDYYTTASIDKDVNAIIMFTSGTTSQSKGAMISQYNLAANCEASHKAFQFKEGTAGLNILPVHHTYACMYDFLYTVYRHGTLCICSSLKYMQREIQEYKPNHIFLVPLIASKIMKNIKSQIETQGIPANEQNEFARNFLGGNLNYLICGGAKLAGDVVEEYKKLGIHIYRGYGITECSPAVALTYADREYDYSSVGSQIACDEIRIVNGEIQVKGSNIMLGYYENEKATREAMDGEWFKTGDAGYMNERGDLYITGRLKNVIILNNGKNVYPEEIEDLFAARAEAAETMVFEDEGQNGKKVIGIAIYPTDEYRTEDGKKKVMKLAEEINSSLPIYMKYSNVYIIDTPFEKTSTNKIKRSCIETIIKKYKK